MSEREGGCGVRRVCEWGKCDVCECAMNVCEASVQ